MTVRDLEDDGTRAPETVVSEGLHLQTPRATYRRICFDRSSGLANTPRMKRRASCSWIGKNRLIADVVPIDWWNKRRYRRKRSPYGRRTRVFFHPTSSPPIWSVGLSEYMALFLSSISKAALAELSKIKGWPRTFTEQMSPVAWSEPEGGEKTYEGARTPCFSPLSESEPFFFWGHIQHVSDDWQASRPWRQAQSRLDLDETNDGYEENGESEGKLPQDDESEVHAGSAQGAERKGKHGACVGLPLIPTDLSKTSSFKWIGTRGRINPNPVWEIARCTVSWQVASPETRAYLEEVRGGVPCRSGISRQ